MIMVFSGPFLDACLTFEKKKCSSIQIGGLFEVELVGMELNGAGWVAVYEAIIGAEVVELKGVGAGG